MHQEKHAGVGPEWSAKFCLGGVLGGTGKRGRGHWAGLGVAGNSAWGGLRV